MVLHLARKLQVEEVGRMQAAGFVAPLEEHWKYCPYCGIRMRGGCRAMLFKLLLAAGVAAAVIWLIVR